VYARRRRRVRAGSPDGRQGRGARVTPRAAIGSTGPERVHRAPYTLTEISTIFSPITVQVTFKRVSIRPQAVAELRSLSIAGRESGALVRSTPCPSPGGVGSARQRCCRRALGPRGPVSLARPAGTPGRAHGADRPLPRPAVDPRRPPHPASVEVLPRQRRDRGRPGHRRRRSPVRPQRTRHRRPRLHRPHAQTRRQILGPARAPPRASWASRPTPRSSRSG
jgi:hypothetical protein